MFFIQDVELPEEAVATIYWSESAFRSIRRTNGILFDDAVNRRRLLGSTRDLGLDAGIVDAFRASREQQGQRAVASCWWWR